MFEYRIKYPNTWFMFNGATDANIYQINNNKNMESLNTIVFINKIENKKSNIFNISKGKYEKYTTQEIIGKIEIFLLDKDSKLYNIWINDLKNNKVDFAYKMEDFSNLKYNKLNISYNIIEELYKENITKNNLIKLFIDIGENKVLIFTFNNKNNKKL